MQKDLFYPTVPTDRYTHTQFSDSVDNINITNPDLTNAYNVGYISPDVIPRIHKMSKITLDGTSLKVEDITADEYIDVMYTASTAANPGSAATQRSLNYTTKWKSGHTISNSTGVYAVNFPNKVNLNETSMNTSNLKVGFSFAGKTSRYSNPAITNFLGWITYSNFNTLVSAIKNDVESTIYIGRRPDTAPGANQDTTFSFTFKPSDFEKGYVEVNTRSLDGRYTVQGVVYCLGLIAYTANSDTWEGKDWQHSSGGGGAYSTQLYNTYKINTKEGFSYVSAMTSQYGIMSSTTPYDTEPYNPYMAIDYESPFGAGYMLGGCNIEVSNINTTQPYVLGDGCIFINTNNKPRIQIMLSYEEVLRELVLQPRLYIGSNYTTDGWLYNSNIIYPEVIDNEYTGGYLTYADKDLVPDWMKEGDISANKYTNDDKPEYEKEEEDRPKPKPDSNPVLPSDPSFTMATGAGSVCYAITADNFNQIWDDIYGKNNSDWKDLIEGLQLFGSNPLNAILAYRWYPFEFGGTSTAPIILGRTRVNESHQYEVITAVSSSLKKAKGTFWYGKQKNFINSKHCKCRLYLPFYGYVELPMTQVLSKELEIEFRYNAPDDLATWIISFGDVIYDYYECSPYIEIPITGDNSRAISVAKQQQAINTALTVGAAVVGVGMSVLGGYGALAGAANAAGVSVAEYASQAAVNTAAQFGIGSAYYYGAEAASQAATLLGTGAAVGGSIVGGGAAVIKGITNSANQIGTLSTNVPTKAGASATTFLYMPMKPYIQFYTNENMETASLKEYKRTVGIACETWTTIEKMPEESLLAISNPIFNTSGMTQNEQNALISALGSFYK